MRHSMASSVTLDTDSCLAVHLRSRFSKGSRVVLALSTDSGLDFTGIRSHLAIARFACEIAWHKLLGGSATIANAMLDVRQEGDSCRRVDMKRRRWTGEERARIVPESIEWEVNISEVARLTPGRCGGGRRRRASCRSKLVEAVVR